MEKLFIDIDDVICQPNHVYYVNKICGTNITDGDYSGFYIQELIPEEKLHLYHELLSTEYFYSQNNLTPDCVSVIEKLNNVYDVYFLSSCYIKRAEGKAGKVFADKYELITKNFPFISEKKLIIAHNKSLINGGILIDDRLLNLSDNFEKKFLFTTERNKNVPEDEIKARNATRVNSWKEIESLLL